MLNTVKEQQISHTKSSLEIAIALFSYTVFYQSFELSQGDKLIKLLYILEVILCPGCKIGESCFKFRVNPGYLVNQPSNSFTEYRCSNNNTLYFIIF